MTELEAAQQIRDGLLPSPWKLGDMALFALRITGTGLAYRSGLDEHCWRDPALYLNDEFLGRCNGLPIIWEHPKGGRLTSKEFIERNIGSVMLPYIRGNEVWAIARVYDAAAIRLMTDNQLTTSPSVVFTPADGNAKVESADGKVLLLEGRPSLLDHVAVVVAGVWDKGGDPTGVLIEGSDDVSEAKLDQILAGLTAQGARLDAFGTRMDGMEKKLDGATRARKDAENRERECREDAKHFSVRKDGETEEEHKERRDAEEEDLCEQFVKAGMGKEAAAERAKNARAYVDRGDAGKRRDAEERSLREQAEHEGKPRETAADDARHRAALADAQAKADTVAQAFGWQAPRPMSGELLGEYRRRLLRRFLPYSQKFKDVDPSTIQDGSVFDGVEALVFADAITAARTPENFPGMLREVKKTDAAGRVMSEFYGSPLVWMQQFMPPALGVTKFNNQSGGGQR